MPAPGEPEPPDDRHGPTGPTGYAEILAALAELTARLDGEHERAAHRESVIDRLHEENQALRRGELQAVLDPVRASLYRLHDMVRREARRWAGGPDHPDPPGPAHAAALLAAVADEVADALERTGVQRFTVEPGEPHDARRHRPVAAETVTDPGLAGTVVAVRRDGFERDGRVVRKAETVVGKAPEADGDGAQDGRDAPAKSAIADTVPSGRSSGLRENGRGETMNPPR
jgi:molecular chaperone GrpE (heat shock protein)